MNCPYCNKICNYDNILDDYWCSGTKPINDDDFHFFENSYLRLSLFVRRYDYEFLISKYEINDGTDYCIKVHDDSINEKNINDKMLQLIDKTLKLKAFL